MSKRALITGASSGIGEEFAKRLAPEGWTITGVARSTGKLGEVVKALPGEGHRAISADLSTTEGIATVASELRSTKYQLLINNAGVGVFGRFEAQPIDKLRSMCVLSVNATYELAHAFLDGAERGDALINVASLLGLLPFPGAALYTANKAFIVALTEALWFEAKPRGIYVMALCPGVTRTNFMAASGGGEEALPAALFGPVEAVITSALSALERRKSPTIIPGGLNKMFLFSSRMMSRKAMVNLMGGFAPKEALALPPVTK